MQRPMVDATRVEAIVTAVSKPEIALAYPDGSREISFDKAALAEGVQTSGRSYSLASSVFFER